MYRLPPAEVTLSSYATGVVARIDQDSAQLAAALAGEQSRIVITTLQKFPFILDKVIDLGQRRFAVIVDEAHSSQTGEAAKDLKAVLGAASAEAQLKAAEGAEAVDVPLDPQDALATTVAAISEARDATKARRAGSST